MKDLINIDSTTLIAFMLNTLLPMTAVCLLGVVTVYFFFAHNPAVRYRICLVVLSCVLLSPIMFFVQRNAAHGLLTLSLIPAARQNSNPPVYQPPHNLTAAIHQVNNLPVEIAVPIHISERTAPKKLINLGLLAMLLWIAGVVYGAMRVAIGWKQIYKLRTSTNLWNSVNYVQTLNSVEAVLGSPLPAVYTSTDVKLPVAVGVFHPAVILPEGLSEKLDATQLRQILLHECAHITFRHTIGGVIERLARLLFWPHPLVHILCRELARAREELCDNVASQEVGPICYARTLLSIDQERSASPDITLALSIMGLGTSLEKRISGLLNPKRNLMIREKPLKLMAVTSVLTLAFVCCVMIKIVAVEKKRHQELVKNLSAGAQSAAFKYNDYKEAGKIALDTPSGKTSECTDSKALPLPKSAIEKHSGKTSGRPSAVSMKHRVNAVFNPSKFNLSQHKNINSLSMPLPSPISPADPAVPEAPVPPDVLPVALQYRPHMKISSAILTRKNRIDTEQLTSSASVDNSVAHDLSVPNNNIVTRNSSHTVIVKKLSKPLLVAALTLSSKDMSDIDQSEQDFNVHQITSPTGVIISNRRLRSSSDFHYDNRSQKAIIGTTQNLRSNKFALNISSNSLDTTEHSNDDAQPNRDQETRDKFKAEHAKELANCDKVIADCNRDQADRAREQSDRERERSDRDRERAQQKLERMQENFIRIKERALNMKNQQIERSREINERHLERSRNRARHDREQAENMHQHAMEMAQNAREHAQEEAENAREHAREQAANAREHALEQSERVKEQNLERSRIELERATERAERSVQQQIDRSRRQSEHAKALADRAREQAARSREQANRDRDQANRNRDLTNREGDSLKRSKERAERYKQQSDKLKNQTEQQKNQTDLDKAKMDKSKSHPEKFISI